MSVPESSWTKPHDLKAQIEKLWDRGELLRDCVTGASRFPLRLSLKSPSSTDISEKFSEVRRWTSILASESTVRVEWQDVRHRVQGTQRIPASIWIDSLEIALRWIRKQDDWQSFSSMVDMTAGRQPSLLAWLERYSMRALKFSQSWPQLLDVIDWLQANQRPGIYLRQVDLPGVHSKLIEKHLAVLSELLDITLPETAIDPNWSGISGFCARYGFLDKPSRIRFRILDQSICPLPGLAQPDITLDAASFAQLSLQIDRVFITENEVNFLAFPQVAKSIVIFGAGYGWDSLSRSEWLSNIPIYYWGDIDTHGFAILSDLRKYFSHVRSFLMDMETLTQHRYIWGREDTPSSAQLSRLEEDEQHLFNCLRDNAIQNNLRLEQEHIGYQWMLDRVKQLG